MYQLTAVKPKSLALQSLPSVQSQQFRCNRQPKARIDQLVVFSRDEVSSGGANNLYLDDVVYILY